MKLDAEVPSIHAGEGIPARVYLQAAEDKLATISGAAILTMYKPANAKIKPLAMRLPEKYTGQRFFRPELSRDPHATPLSWPVPKFVPGR